MERRRHEGWIGRAVSVLLGLAACGALVAPASGQILTGQLFTPEGEPVPGALVEILGAGGDTRLGAYVTAADGLFAFRVDRGGSYDLRVARPGRRDTLVAGLALPDTGRVLHSVVLEPSPIRFTSAPPDRVDRCSISALADVGDDAPRARAWRAIRDLLEAVRWTHGQAGLAYRVRVTVEERDREGRVLRSVSETARRDVGAVPPGPAPERFATGGFLRETSDGSIRLAAPNPALVLSQPFEASYCVRAVDVRGPERVVVSVSAAPDVGSDPEREDLALRFDLDARTGVLERIAFVPAPPGATGGAESGVVDSGPGGEIVFGRSGDGRWIVDRWELRSRRGAAGPGGVEVGGAEGLHVERVEVLASGPEAVIAASEPGAARLDGVVWDSVTNRPLGDARILVDGEESGVRSDADGRFALVVPGAATTVGFDHPRLEELGILSLAPAPIPWTADGTEPVRLAVPSTPTLLVRRCRTAAPGREPRVILGRVTTPTGESLPGARVLLWPGDGGDASAPTRETRTTPDGWYALCDVPSAGTATVRASVLGRVGGERRLALDERSAPVTEGVDLVVALDALAASTTDSGPPAGPRQAVVGQVREAGSGRTIRAAAVELRDAAGRVVRETTTDADGRFVVAAPAAGSYALRASALGYEAAQGAVRVETGDPAVVDVELSVDAVPLEPITVVAEARDATLSRRGFYLRREASTGVFIDREEIETRSAGAGLFDLFAGIPGVRLHHQGFRDRSILIKGTESLAKDLEGIEVCWPRVYLDGSVVLAGGSVPARVDEIAVRPEALVGIEVYRGGAETPARYGGSQAACGVILLWTGR